MLRYLVVFLALSPLAHATPPIGKWRDHSGVIDIQQNEVAGFGKPFPFDKEVVVNSYSVGGSDFFTDKTTASCRITTRIAARKGDVIVLVEAMRSRPVSFTGSFFCGATRSVSGYSEPYRFAQMVIYGAPENPDQLFAKTLDVSDHMGRPVLTIEELLDPNLGARFEESRYVQHGVTALDPAELK